MQPHTVITQSPAVVRYVPAVEPVVAHVQKSIFGLDLPAGWQAVNDPNAPPGVYGWHGTATVSDQARRLDVYIDQPRPSLAVNRLLPVVSVDAGLQVVGSVSDNCIGFTDKTPDAIRAGQALSRWDGVNFNCDTGNYERDVVAIGSADGVNAVSVTGRVNGRHQVLLVYTDDSASADYTIFTAIVASFKVL